MLHEFACHPCTRAIANLLCIAPILVCVLPKQALHMYLFIYYVCVLSCFSRVHLVATPWNVAHQAPLLVGFSRQEYWSGLPCPSPGDLPDSGIEPISPVAPARQADSLALSHQGSLYLFTTIECKLHWKLV